VSLDPAYKAGLAGHLPAINKTAKEKSPDATPPFGFAQGRESFDLAQDRELVERHVERPFGFTQGHEPVEWQKDF
jgi:hypothetical protein